MMVVCWLAFVPVLCRNVRSKRRGPGGYNLPEKASAQDFRLPLAQATASRHRTVCMCEREVGRKTKVRDFSFAYRPFMAVVDVLYRFLSN